MTPLSPPQLATLRAALDRIIPADDLPGALAAGTDTYVITQLAGPCAAERPALLAGLAQLDATAATRHAGVTFAALPPASQDTLLAELDAAGAPFFTRLVELAHEGFYADPANGGNRDAVSWRMLGYDPRTSGTIAQSPERSP